MYTRVLKNIYPTQFLNRFYWLPVTPLEKEDMLKASDQKKACGHDNLPVKLYSAQYKIIKPSFLRI